MSARSSTKRPFHFSSRLSEGGYVGRYQRLGICSHERGSRLTPLSGVVLRDSVASKCRLMAIKLSSLEGFGFWLLSRPFRWVSPREGSERGEYRPQAGERACRSCNCVMRNSGGNEPPSTACGGHFPRKNGGRPYQPTTPVLHRVARNRLRAPSCGGDRGTDA